MKQITTPYRDIQRILLSSRFIVISALATTLTICCYAIFTTSRIHRESRENAYAVAPNGQVLPLALVNRADNLEVEILNHLEVFHRNFYGINSSNYKDRIEKALWLGDTTIDQVYKQKRADGIYNKLVQFNLIQNVEKVASQLSLVEGTIHFRTTVDFSIERGTIVDRFQIMTTGTLDHIERNFPKNPHGLLIKNFFEREFKKLANDE